MLASNIGKPTATDNQCRLIRNHGNDAHREIAYEHASRKTDKLG